MVAVTVIVITKNEEKNIEKCLRACRPASQVFVVDSNSQDRTIDIAEKYISKKNIINFKWNGKWPKKKCWSLQNLDINNEWVLMLDADEIPTKKFWKKLTDTMVENKYDAYFVPFRYWFMGKEIKHGDPVRKLVLFKWQKVKYNEPKNDLIKSSMDQEVHEHPVVEGKVGIYKEKINHDDYKGLYNYFERHNKYSSWEALLLRKRYYQKNDYGANPELFGNAAERRRWMKNFLMNTPFKPLMYFVYSYIFRLGFLDGKVGFDYTMCKCFYLMQIEMKVNERKKISLE